MGGVDTVASTTARVVYRHDTCIAAFDKAVSQVQAPDAASLAETSEARVPSFAEQLASIADSIDEGRWPDSFGTSLLRREVHLDPKSPYIIVAPIDGYWIPHVGLCVELTVAFRDEDAHTTGMDLFSDADKCFDGPHRGRRRDMFESEFCDRRIVRVIGMQRT